VFSVRDESFTWMSRFMRMLGQATGQSMVPLLCAIV
jgi:hypothetical protein